MRKRKGLIFLITFLLVTGIITGGILAEESKDDGSATAVDPATGKVTFSLPKDFEKQYGETLEDFKEEGDLVVGLYKVADIYWNGSTAKFEFSGSEKVNEILAEYFEEGKSGYVIDADAEDVVENMEAAAKELAGLGIESLSPDNIELGKDAEVAEGLYLVVPHNKEREDYITTVTDEEGNEVTVSYAYTTAKEYDFTLNLLALSAAQSDLLGNKDVTLKPEAKPRMGRIEIDKILSNYLSYGTFVFSVNAEYEGKVVLNDVRSLTFTEAGSQSIVIDDIPVGSVVTVKEIYSGAIYELSSDSKVEQEQTIDQPFVDEKTGTVFHFEFINIYNNSNNHGYGIDNMFVKDDNGDWEYVKGGEE